MSEKMPGGEPIVDAEFEDIPAVDPKSYEGDPRYEVPGMRANPDDAEKAETIREHLGWKRKPEPIEAEFEDIEQQEAAPGHDLVRVMEGGNGGGEGHNGAGGHHEEHKKHDDHGHHGAGWKSGAAGWSFLGALFSVALFPWEVFRGKMIIDLIKHLRSEKIDNLPLIGDVGASKTGKKKAEHGHGGGGSHGHEAPAGGGDHGHH